MRNRAHKSARRHGFTLIELIAALTMSAILAVSLGATFQIAFNAVDAAKNAVAAPRTADITMQYLGNDFQNTAPFMTQLAQVSPILQLQQQWYEGTQGADDRGHESDDVVFYGTADSPQHASANGEIKQIELKVVTSPGGDHVLVRRIVRNLLATTGNTTPDEEVICRGVSSFTLEYFDGSAWQKAWDSVSLDNTIPVAVRVTLELERPGDKTGARPFKYVRTFPLSCSTAASDTNVNSGVSVN